MKFVCIIRIRTNSIKLPEDRINFELHEVEFFILSSIEIFSKYLI